MPLDRRHLLRTALGTAVAVGMGAPQRALTRLSPAVDGAGTRRLGGFRSQAGGSGDGARITEPVEAARRFGMVGITAPPGADVAVRVSRDGERFGPWLAAHAQDVEREGPDRDEARAAGQAWQRNSAPVYTGTARWLQLRVDGVEVDDVEAILVGTDERDADVAAAALVSTTGPTASTRNALWRGGLDEPDTLLPVGGGLRILSRADWGADESLRGDPSYAERVLHGIVHHTAGSNDYTPSQAPGIVRGIYRYHVESNGWKDIGYNLLVDRYGVIYEGRYGGLDRPVIGAHARGANTGSFGVGVIGDFRWEELPSDARWAVLELLKWKFDLHAIDPFGTVTAAGHENVPTLAGHRDVGSTECPGGTLYARLDPWRDHLRRELGRPDGFSDIAGHPHEESIRSLRAAGVTNGYSDGTYRPEQHVTRAQMATFITRAAPLEPGPPPGFHDVTRDHPHYDGIAAVAAAGIAEGRADGNYRPSNDVTRGQMASFLSRALDLEPRDDQTFSDVGRDHPHYGAIEAVAHEGVALGRDDGTYRPDRPVTRGQMASFLVRAFEIPPADEGPQDPGDLEDEEPDEHDPHDDEHADEDQPEGEGPADGGPGGEADEEPGVEAQHAAGPRPGHRGEPRRGA